MMVDTMRCQSRTSNEAVETVTAPTLLLMAGFAGAGKTTLARWLHEQLGWVVLNKDDFKLARLMAGAEKKANPLEWSVFVEKAGREAFDELLEKIPLSLSQKRSVIIDTSNEKPLVFQEMNDIQARLREQAILSRSLIVFCRATQKTRAVRLDKRKSVFFPLIEELPPVVDDSEESERFKHFIHSDNVIRLDTNGPFNTYADEALRSIKLFLNNG